MIIRLKCESDSKAYDQEIKVVMVERDTAEGWYGRPAKNPSCPLLLYPKFAWKKV